MTETDDRMAHARANGMGWLSSIKEMVAALECDRDRLQELRDERDGWENGLSEQGNDALIAYKITGKLSTVEHLAEEAGLDVPAFEAGCDEMLAAGIDATWNAESNRYVITGDSWAEQNPDEAEELAELESACKIDGEEVNEEEARERIEESPLSVEVRSGWYAPGGEPEAEEYCILLSTGGPALRIVGDLGQFNQPSRARLEMQDWFTPWTEIVLDVDDEDVLLKFAQAFYFGD